MLRSLFSQRLIGGIHSRNSTAPLSSLTVFLCLLFSLVLTPIARADCPPRFFPAGGDESLYINGSQWQQMQALRLLVDQCPQLAADYAQQHFWGGQGLDADIHRSWYFAQQARGSVVWSDQLRLLRSAYVVLGLSDEFSVEAALRRLRREVRRQPAIYAEKAWAVLNQLLLWLPLREAQGQLGLQLPAALGSKLLVSDKQGLPIVVNGQASQPSQQQPLALFYPRSGSQRLRLWRMPASPGHSWRIGRLRGQYASGNGHCTATALNERWVISAAHCLYSASAQPQLVEHLRFYPRPVEQPDEYVRPTRAWLLNNRHEQLLRGDVDAYTGSDLALLELSQPLRGPFQGAELGVAESLPHAVRLLSYPMDTAAGSLWLSFCEARPLAGSRGVVMAVLALDCDSRRGQSGALLWSDEPEPRALGLLSANVWTQGSVQSVAAAFDAPMLADIARILRGRPPANSHWQHLEL